MLYMQRFYTEPTPISPEILFSAEENKFFIKGNSAPEDVRALYYPVIEWIKVFIDDVNEGEYPQFSQENPIKFQVDLDYFNSSSAKFLFDIFTELKRLVSAKKPVLIEWFFDEEDIDHKEAGCDLAILAGIEFTFISKSGRSDEGTKATL
jgi:hypothetical protein